MWRRFSGTQTIWDAPVIRPNIGIRNHQRHPVLIAIEVLAFAGCEARPDVGLRADIEQLKKTSAEGSLYAIPFGVANVVQEGSDATIVAIGRMVPEAVKAAKKLAESGIAVEIIDPRTVQPLDTDTIVASVKKTNRALVVHEAVEFGGIGAEISAQIQESAFDYLDAPVAQYWPTFASHGKGGVLVRHALTHTAGQPAPTMHNLFQIVAK